MSADLTKTPERAFFAAADVYLTLAKAVFRLTRYARITIKALFSHKETGAEHRTPVLDSTMESLASLMVFLDARDDRRFLEEEMKQGDSIVMNQTAVSIWGALEVFVNDLVIAVLTTDPARIASLPNKIRIPVADFYSMNQQEQTENIVELAKQETRSSLKTGVGAFESLLEAFGLGGEVASATRRELVELSAMRNCIVHRKGIVDARFLEACGTTNLKLGDAILLTAERVDRFMYAAQQYGGAVLDRIKDRYAPGFDFESPTAWFLAELEKKQSTQ